MTRGLDGTFTNSDGTSPMGSLVQSGDDFYGTTSRGGGHNHGTVFKITTSGSLTTLYSFNGTDGADPYAGLVQGRDGDFYGTTTQGGAHDKGTVFKIAAKGSFTSLHSFGAVRIEGDDDKVFATKIGTGTVTGLHLAMPAGASPEGAYPWGGLVQGRDGDFYGTTQSGGIHGTGTVFRITSSGSLTTLHAFSADTNPAAKTNMLSFVINHDGARPTAGLIQGSDGDFYGTMEEGGSAGHGTIFKITATGELTTLHVFIGTSDGSNNDGEFPHGGLIPGNDGIFYGTTDYGGTYGCGTVFQLTTGVTKPGTAR
jgi:uncharacterized repeat protein (TIGR03803 family)